MALILLILQVLSFVPQQEYIMDRYIPWRVLAEYFPRILNGKVGDGEIKGYENKAGPASSSFASRTYGEKKYTLTMQYRIENNLSTGTRMVIGSHKSVATAKTHQTLNDDSVQSLRIGKYNAIGRYNALDKSAEITVFLENHVTVKLVVKDAKHLDDARVVFKVIELDRINELEP